MSPYYTGRSYKAVQSTVLVHYTVVQHFIKKRKYEWNALQSIPFP